MEIQGKINNFLDPYSNAANSAANLEKSGDAKLKGKTGTSTSESSQGDTVTVSQDALLLTEARRTAQNTPDVRAEKVEALRTQVADGTYNADSKLIAASLVREEPGLFR